VTSRLVDPQTSDTTHLFYFFSSLIFSNKSPLFFPFNGLLFTFYPPNAHSWSWTTKAPVTMALDNYYRNKIESMKLEIIQGQAVLRRLEAQRNDYNSRVRLLREELGLLQQPGSYVGEVVKVMSTKKVLVKVHPEGKYGESRE
jgi:hypothetical protein